MMLSSAILNCQFRKKAGAYPGGLWGPRPPGSLKGHKRKEEKGKGKKKRGKKE